MNALTITHSHEEGTLIDGTSRGDGSAEILKATSWRWSRSLGSWYIRGSRDHDARTWQINTTADRLREAGFEVEVEIDNTARPIAQVEADRIDRAHARADALDAKAEKLHATAEARHAAADQIAEHIPFGQPILVGHHSERRARRDQDRIHSNMRAGFEAEAAANAAAGRAATARAGTRPESPTTTANRIDKLRAEIRQFERNRRTYTLATDADSKPFVIAEVQHHNSTENDARLASLQEHLAYWEKVRAQQIADGEVVDVSTAKAGDYARVSGSWWRIKRVNAKTLTLVSSGCSIRAPHHQVTALRTATDTADTEDPTATE